MSEKPKRPKDRRPKIISFGTELSGLDIAAEQDILWPCHSFTISIPQKQKSSLNIFEETILKMTEIESSSTEKLAQNSCLDQEVVAFIQNRLNHSGLLTERYELSAQGSNLLQKLQDTAEMELQYTVATVFIDLLSGKLIPYIHTGSLEQEKILAIDDSFIILELGSTGKSYKKSCRKISPNENSFWNQVPASKDIIRAIKIFKKQRKSYALLKQDFNSSMLSVPNAEAISVAEKPEFVYLHCQAFLQVGSYELLVTDGFGFGISESFSNYLGSKEWKWIIELKKKGYIDKIDNPENTYNKAKNKPFKYVAISKIVAKSKRAIQEIKQEKVDSSYSEKEYKQKIESATKNLYLALEQTLRQVVIKNPASEWYEIYVAGNLRSNKELLVGLAKKIGFVVSDKNKSLLLPAPSALKRINNGKVEFQPLLALAIAGATSSANHPMYNLAQKYPEFLSHSLRLKNYRDPIEHGSTEDLHIKKTIAEELFEKTLSMIATLVPEIIDDLKKLDALDKIDAFVKNDDINQRRLKANIALDETFGVAFVSNLSGDIKEQLLRAELMLAQFDSDKSIEIIKCYASVMQNSIFDAIKNRRFEIENDFNNNKAKKLAIAKMLEFKFYSTNATIPKEVSSVNSSRFSQVFQGLNTSLGANLLAIFLLGSESELIKLYQKTPKFAEFVAKLISLRGHGNQNLDNISQDDIRSLKEELSKAIKAIKEIF